MIYLLYVLLAVLIIIAALLFIPFDVHIKYLNDVTVYIRFLFLRYTLFPFKEKEEKEEKNEKVKNKKKESSQNKKPKKEKAKRPLNETLTLVRDILKGVMPKFKVLLKKIKITDFKLEMKISSDDSAKTALNYGRTQIILPEIFKILESLFTFKIKEIYVYPDFKDEKTEIYLETDVKITIISLLAFLYYSYKDQKKNIKKLIS